MCFKRIANAYRIYICGHDKSAPTAANNLPIMLLTDYNNTTFKTQKQPPF
ncbi:hypothetical protein HMPREF9144_2293 [Prevotella pallens ATCC 700821]|uniref:Uncharacterized protein n=1 Tax=Prevotella pallens ATCC 700821 TaxID=997353 RepID=F9DKV1_9BACT|nr:hypothetical protein HMPREF9144_2293 [Prevotella pallens ATCC 700821]